MRIKHSHLLFAITAALSLSACGTAKPILDDGQYWQRISTSESVYLQGQKAQQMLNRDIARCVTELREMERLGMVRNAIPTDIEGRVLDPDDKKLKDWDAPERDRHLFAEHEDFQDFETCMLAKGWERVLHVPFDVARRARDAYVETHLEYNKTSYEERRTKPKTTQNFGDYGGLNE